MKILFETNKKNPISRIICFFTKNKNNPETPISHAAPIYGEAFGAEWGLSADEILINVVDINRYRNSGYVFRIYEIPDRIDPIEWIPKLTDKYNQKVYPHFELLWFVYRWFRRLFNKNWTGNNWFSYSEFCSELTILAMKLAGYEEEVKNLNPNTTDAIELESIVKNIKSSELIEIWNDELIYKKK